MVATLMHFGNWKSKDKVEISSESSWKVQNILNAVFGVFQPVFPRMRVVHSPEMTRYAARITMQNQDRRAVANKKYIFTFMTAI